MPSPRNEYERIENAVADANRTLEMQTPPGGVRYKVVAVTVEQYVYDEEADDLRRLSHYATWDARDGG